MKYTRRIVLVAMFTALCGIGSLIKIPLGINSAALDSTPALLSVPFLPPMFAGLVGLMGHLATAFTSGFIFGPFHILIALEMFVILFVFAKLHSAGYTFLKWTFFIISNGFLAIIPFYFLFSPQFFVMAIPPILLATIINAVIGAITMPLVEKLTVRVGEFQ